MVFIKDYFLIPRAEPLHGEIVGEGGEEGDAGKHPVHQLLEWHITLSSSSAEREQQCHTS